MIDKKIAEKYNISLEFFKEKYDDENEALIMFCRCFLDATDYICNKIVEGVATWDDYADEKKYRQIARAEINKLRK